MGTCRLRIRQVLYNGLENSNYQIQKPDPVEHPVTSFLWFDGE
jgi:antitoxin component HigA of HigAB toxin-antitoxin module